MGCHTWFSVPYKNSKKEIIEMAQAWLDNSDHISEGHKKMYQWAIDNEIADPVIEIASYESDTTPGTNWVLYKDVTLYSIEEYNKKNNTSIDRYSSEFDKIEEIEKYSDEPRIGGYPNRVIRSYDEMVEFIETGHDVDGTHYDFFYDEDRIDKVMNGIYNFFEKHPDGIITFG